MTIKRLMFIGVMLVFLFIGAGVSADVLAGSNIVTQDLEIRFLQSEFKRTVNDDMVLRDGYRELSSAIMLKMIKDAPDVFAQSQFFVYADRNPSVGQLIMICFYDSLNGEVKIIGADKISTGNPKRKEHFITPTGIFENKIENFSYRALGTRNGRGWRGLGAKGSRVWDFGWQETVNMKNEKILIRLLMHATDPDFGEPRLGKVDSKGCVRVSAKMNVFLDHFGIIDKEYEGKKSIQKISHILREDRVPAAFAGKYLLVGDSESAL